MKPVLSLRHAALCVTDIAKSLRLYCDVLGMQPYHTSDRDWAMVHSEGTSLSLVRVAVKQPSSMAGARGSHPAHLGLVAKSKAAVAEMHAALKAQSLVVGSVESHRDGSEGFYFQDYDGNQLECIFIPYQGEQVRLDEAVVLIAHGSRDPKWKLPLQTLAEKVRLHAPGRSVGLAYMEMCEPTLEQVVATLHQQGIRKFEVVPVFLSSGAHVKEDIPQLLKQCQATFADSVFRSRAALGEADAVLEAMTAEIIG